MIHDEDDDVHWADDIKDFQSEYTPIPCWSVLQFFELKGRTTTLVKDNLVYARYSYYAVYDPNVKRYYKRLGRKYELDDLYYYKGGDVAIDHLLRYVADKNLTLLMPQLRVESVSETLKRLYKGYFNEDGKLDYRLYIKILDLSLKIEDYTDIGKNLTGYRTALNQMETQLRELWEKARTLKK